MLPVPVFVGYDPREAVAYHVCCNSIIRLATAPVAIVPLALNLMTDYQETHTDGSNTFVYSRFLVPYLMGYQGRAIFIDGDMVLQSNILELFDLLSNQHAVAVVKHDYQTRSAVKYLGNANHNYPRKNWSSVIVWNCGHAKNRVLTPDLVQRSTGSRLHRFGWLDDADIGELPRTWNWLPDELGANPEAKLLHYTLGTPCFAEYKSVPQADAWHQERRLAQHPS
jgi:lipopolysaccharide biosynthesis glycosyltransferase